MKVLYAIQSTGNGHISRAKELIPFMSRRFQFDVIISGPKPKLDLGYPIKKNLKGLTLFYNKKGGIDWIKTLFKNNLLLFFRDIINLRVKDYDLVINDFEPISAWSCKLKRVPCFGISNQLSLLKKGIPKPKKKFKSTIRFLKLFAPINIGYGLHYQKFSKKIYHPIIRSKVKKLITSKGMGIVVYLPAYDEKSILEITNKFPHQQWHIFSRNISQKKTIGSSHLYPIHENVFLELLSGADGVITNAGFTTTSESLFLNKPLLVIPMKGHIEQIYNAVSLDRMGVKVLKIFSLKQLDEINFWLNNPKSIKINFENDSGKLIDQIAIDFIKMKLNQDLLAKAF
tara:strand:- start:1299 stop:2324 length:1026 start_codon:yes stop_codon:yes gene_type:complete